MIINYSKPDKERGIEHEGIYITESKDNVRMSKTGKAYSMLVLDTAQIKVKKDDKEVMITGKELINAIFAK